MLALHLGRVHASTYSADTAVHLQTPYEEGNPYSTDTVLPSLLKRLLPANVFNEVNPDLERFGGEVLTSAFSPDPATCTLTHPLTALRTISATVAEPKLVQYDHWGQRIDDLQTSEGWRGLKAKMQEEGIVGIYYERRHQELSRVHGFMKQLLATADSDTVSMFLLLFICTLISSSPIDFLSSQHDRRIRQRLVLAT